MEIRRVLAVASCAVAVGALGAGSAFAGEITGNGVEKGVNGNSPCSFSGQEDLQYAEGGSKGDPAHSQNWGHVKQTDNLTGGANYVPSWGWGCNGHDFGLHGGTEAP